MERPKLQVERSRRLRRDATWPEKILWSHLRAGNLNGLKFRRQHPLLGHVVDFACPAAKVAVELDGKSHDEARASADTRKDEVLEENGWHVMRFPNSDVSNHLDALLENVLEVCNQRITTKE